MSRQDFIEAAASEKITLVRLQATKRFINYTTLGGGIYFKQVPHFVIGVKILDGVDLTEGANASVSAGEFYYDIQASTLYIHLPDSSDPNSSVLVSTVQKFYSTHPVSLPHDLQEGSFDVYWDGRVSKSPNFKSQIGINQNLVSTIGQGSIELANTDAELDDIYDDLVFENQLVDVFSLNRKQPLSEARKIFTGIIHDKGYTSEDVTFTVKDQLFNLLERVPQGVYDENDNVNSDVVGRAKRWVYGRVDGLQIQSIDQIGSGYVISGTVSSTSPVKEQTKLVLNSGSAPSYNSRYFFVNKSNGRTKYYFWFDVDNSGTDPQIADRTGTEINLSSGDGLSQIKEKIEAKLEDRDFEVLSAGGSEVLFNDDQTGEAEDAENVDAPITVSVETQGKSGSALAGVGTLFLSEVSPEDEIFIGTQEFRVQEVRSDTELVLDDEVAFEFSGLDAKIIPNIPTTAKNRDFFVAEHATAELNRTVVNALQFNRIELNDTSGILSGDILEFTVTGERVEVKNIAPGNIAVLRQNLLTLPSIGDAVVRQPIQDVFVNGTRLNNADYTVNNGIGSTSLTVADDAEFNIAPIQNFTQTLTFTNGSRTITGPVGLPEFFQPRQFIRPEDITYSTFYEILDVTDDEIILREPFTEVTLSDTAEVKRPDYIGDNSIVSTNLLGRTKDGTPTGDWIQTSAEVVRDLVSAIGLTDRINETSFNDTSTKTPQLVSLAIPIDRTASKPTVKDISDTMGQSTYCALTLDNDLKLRYTSTLVFTPEEVTIVDDSDAVRWSIKSKSGKLYKFSEIRYRHNDVDRFTLEPGSQIATKTSKFVDNFVGTSKTIDQDIYVYSESDAQIFSERILYYNSLSLAEITIETDLRLEGLEIGDVVQLEFDRLYKRLGDNDSRKKLAAVSGRVVTGDRLTITLTDYGNAFNTSAFITVNTAVDYDLSDADERIKRGFITDEQGIVNSVETTAEINKIS